MANEDAPKKKSKPVFAQVGGYCDFNVRKVLCLLASTPLEEDETKPAKILKWNQLI